MMKAILLFIVLLLYALATSAQEELLTLDVYATEISPGETVQAEIFTLDPIAEPKAKDIKLYKGETPVTIAPFFSKLEDNHYFVYFELPLSAGDGEYTLKVEKISFIVDSILQHVTQETSFTVTTTPPSVEIFPGQFYVFNTAKQVLIVNMQSKDVQTNVQITTPEFITHPYTSPQIVEVNKIRKFKLTIDPSSVQGITKEEIVITYGAKTMIIPIWVVGQGTVTGSSEEVLTFIVAGNTITYSIDADETLKGSMVNLNLRILLTSTICGLV